MTQYFAVIEGDGRHGPFASISAAHRLLKQVSRTRAHTDEDAHHFFLCEVALEQVDTSDGKTKRINLGWLERPAITEQWQGLIQAAQSLYGCAVFSL